MFLWFRRSLPTWNPLAQVVAIFTQEDSKEHRRKDINYVIQIFFAYRMLNVNVISIGINKKSVQVYTWYPYGNGKCAKNVADILIVDECLYDDQGNVSNIFSHNDLLPKIPKDLHQCELVVAASFYEPYTFYDKQRGFYDGVEIHLVQMISRALNMKIKYLLMNETRENRFVSNDTGIYAPILQRFD